MPKMEMDPRTRKKMVVFVTVLHKNPFIKIFNLTMSTKCAPIVWFLLYFSFPFLLLSNFNFNGQRRRGNDFEEDGVGSFTILSPTIANLAICRTWIRSFARELSYAALHKRCRSRLAPRLRDGAFTFPATSPPNRPSISPTV